MCCALRISAEYGHNSGYVDHYALDGSLALGTATAGALIKSGVNSDNNLAVNVKALWTPSDNISVTPAVLYQRTRARRFLDFHAGLGLFNEFNQVPGYDRDELFIPSLTVKAGLGFADFTSVSGFVNRNVLRDADGTYYNTTAVVQFYLDTQTTPPYTTNAAANNNILGNIPSPVTFTDHFNTFTQEFRLSSPAEQKAHQMGRRAVLFQPGVDPPGLRAGSRVLGRLPEHLRLPDQQRSGAQSHDRHRRI